MTESNGAIFRYGYTAEEYKKFNKWAWIVLWAFSILYCFLYIMRFNLGLAMPIMAEQLGMSLTSLGVLSSVQFWVYGFGHLFNGRLGEAIGPNKFIIAGISLSVIANVFMGFQSTLIGFCIVWGVNGYAQSMLWSVGMSFLSKWWPAAKRGFATGFANSVGGMGTPLAWIVMWAVFAIFPDASWKVCFWAPAVIVVASIVVYAIIVKKDPTAVGLKPYEEEDKDMVAAEEAMQAELDSHGYLYPYLYLLKQWRFIIWMFIIFCSSLSRYGLLTWIPTYYTEVFGVDLEEGLLGSVGLPLGIAIGALVVPLITDRLPGNGQTTRALGVVICGIAAACLVFVFMNAGPGFGAWLLLFFAGFFIYGVNSLVWAFATDIGGRVFAGTAAGVLDWAAYMAAAMQSMFFGSILDATGNWNVVMLTVAGACLAMVVLALIAKPRKAK